MGGWRREVNAITLKGIQYHLVCRAYRGKSLKIKDSVPTNKGQRTEFQGHRTAIYWIAYKPSRMLRMALFKA